MTPTWTALVTAGTSGIGRAATRTLARDGATVIVTGRAANRGEEVASAIGADGGDARFIAADLPVPADVSRLAGEVGDVDILVNAKGGGAIINVSTMVADFGMAGMSAYEVSKAATNLLTKAWAAEYGPLGVRVNAVSPGPTRTPGSAPMGRTSIGLRRPCRWGVPQMPRRSPRRSASWLLCTGAAGPHEKDDRAQPLRGVSGAAP
jgi:NAD(P)-dependent dehydrogenase (short-subunit alcohol dehydrogenase family)